MLFTHQFRYPTSSCSCSSFFSHFFHWIFCMLSVLVSLLLLLLMSSLWQRDRCPLSSPPLLLFLPSHCLIVWRCQFCFISVYSSSSSFVLFFRFSSAFCSLLSLAPFDSPKMKRQSARCDNRHTFEFYWLACHTSISHTHTHTQQQVWKRQKRRTSWGWVEEEGGTTKLLRDANGMAGWLVFWCHIERSVMIPNKCCFCLCYTHFYDRFTVLFLYLL